jgi:hypothetical protein
MYRWIWVALLGIGGVAAGALACSTTPAAPIPVADAGGDAIDEIPAPLRTCEEDPGCPSKIQPSFLQLWLKADQGLVCDTGVSPARVTQWTDQSVGQHSATVHPGAMGPRCGEVTIKGLPAVSFRPDRSTTGQARLDETLDVDLSWLTTNEYTIFVVERRTVPGIQLGILTTEYGSFTGSDSPGCAGDAGATTPGYIELAWGPPANLTSTHRCGASVYGYHGFEGETAAPVILTSSSSHKNGRRLSIDGTELKRSALDTAGITLPANKYPQFTGAIGRTHNARIDNRYAGDIAEIVVYMVALSNADELAVLQYLYLKWK